MCSVSYVLMPISSLSELDKSVYNCALAGLHGSATVVNHRGTIERRVLMHLYTVPDCHRLHQSSAAELCRQRASQRAYTLLVCLMAGEVTRDNAVVRPLSAHSHLHFVVVEVPCRRL